MRYPASIHVLFSQVHTRMCVYTCNVHERNGCARVSLDQSVSVSIHTYADMRSAYVRSKLETFVQVYIARLMSS
jgi:hypothetical protein